MNIDMREAALRLARHGFRVFPLPAGQKSANLKGWQDKATGEAAQIESWWLRGSPANIGIAAGRGLLVLDEDPRHGSEAALAALERLHAELPPTLTAQTPSGGHHRFFCVPAGTRIRNSASKIGPGLDIKSDGGYVVASPSVLVAGDKQTAGSYRWENQLPIANAPDWLIEAAIGAREHAERTEPVAPVGAEFAELETLLASFNPDTDYDEWIRVGMALHHETAGTGFALWDEWSAKGSKYKGAADLRSHWQSFRADAANPVTLGSLRSAVVAKLEDFSIDPPEPDPVASAAPTEHHRFTPISVHEFVKGAPPEYLVDGVLPRAGLAVVYGASGSGKTFWVSDIVSAIARGVEWRNRQVKQGRVVYICAEGVAGFRKRLLAYTQQAGIRPEDFPIGIIPDSPNLLEEKDASALIAAIRSSGGADVIVVDTLAAASPGGNENSSEDMGRVLARCKALHVATGALVILIHHSGKDETKGARGWSGLRAAADAEIEIARNGENRSARITKMKDGEENGAFPFRLLPVTLAFGDNPTTSCVVEHTDASQGVRDNRNAPRGAIEKLAVSVAAELMPDFGVGVAVGALIDAMVLRMSHDDHDGERDRRRERAKRAIETLTTSGHLECRDNVLRFPFGIDGPAPTPPGDAQEQLLAATTTKPEPPRPRKAQKAAGGPAVDFPDLIGKPVPESGPACEPPKPELRESQC